MLGDGIPQREREKERERERESIYIYKYIYTGSDRDAKTHLSVVLFRSPHVPTFHQCMLPFKLNDSSRLSDVTLRRKKGTKGFVLIGSLFG